MQLLKQRQKILKHVLTLLKGRRLIHVKRGKVNPFPHLFIVKIKELTFLCDKISSVYINMKLYLMEGPRGCSNICFIKIYKHLF